MTKVLRVEAERLTLPLSEIKEYELNNKFHGEKQIEAIRESINRFSYIDEIVVDKNNVIILGHGRLKAIKTMGYDNVAVKRLRLDRNDEKALRYLHNRLSEFDVKYVVKNLIYDVESGVDFSLGNIGAEEFLGNLNIEDFSVKDTGQIKSSEAKIYAEQQDVVDDDFDILASIDDIALPSTNVSVIRGVNIPVNIELYDNLYGEFSKAIKNKIDVGLVLLNGLKDLYANK